MSYNTLEPADIQALREYQKAIGELEAREPERLPHEIWDKLLPQIQATGQVPAEYRDRIGVNDVKERKHHFEGDRLVFDEGEQISIGYYDIEWDRWNEELGELHAKYHDAITKALRYALSNDVDSGEVLSTAELIEHLTDKVISNFSFVNPRDIAIKNGALTSIDGHIAAITADDLKNVLNISSIYKLPASIDRTRAFDKNGKLDSFLTTQEKPEELTELHIGFLMAMFQATLKSNDENNLISLYLPKICRELKIDPRTYSSKRNDEEISYTEMLANRMLEIILPFDSFIGRTPDGGYYRVLNFQGYNPKSKTLTVAAPYLYRIKEIILQRRESTNKKQLHQLLHSSVANEPNHAAVELATRILTGISKLGLTDYSSTHALKAKRIEETTTHTSRSGTKKTKKTTVFSAESDTTEHKTAIKRYEVKYSTLIHECPQFEHELEEIEKAAADGKIKYPTQTYNKKLKDVFTAAFRIIAEKSDAPSKYPNFTLPTMQKIAKGKSVTAYIVPTKTTLNNLLIITYTAK